MSQKQNYFYNIKARSRFSKLRLNTFPTFNFNKSLSNHSSFMLKFQYSYLHLEYYMLYQ